MRKGDGPSKNEYDDDLVEPNSKSSYFYQTLDHSLYSASHANILKSILDVSHHMKSNQGWPHLLFQTIIYQCLKVNIQGFIVKKIIK